MPWASVDANVRLPLTLARSEKRAQRRPNAGARPRGACGFCRCLPARIVGRHENARLDCACACHGAAIAADGRAVRGAREITRFKLNNDLLSCGKSCGTVIFVTHWVFESVYLSQRIVVMSPRPGRVFTEINIDAPYPRDERFGFRGYAASAAGRRRPGRAMGGAA